MQNRIRNRSLMLILAMIAITAASTQLIADTGTCGGASITLPFTDVPAGSVFFCSIGEAYFSALTNGTTSTTYSPGAAVPREQMAAFVTRTMDQSLKRGSRQAALKQWWAPSSASGLATTAVGTDPAGIESDGADLWVANFTTGSVSRVRASDGTKVGADWTGATHAYAVLVAKGRIFVTGHTAPGSLYEIDPTQAPGPVTTLTNSLGENPIAIAFDGARIWTANEGQDFSPSVSIVSLNPLSVSTAPTGPGGFEGILYDGANIWVTDYIFSTLKKLDASGNTVQTVTMGTDPNFPVFDGTNIWVPNYSSNSVMVVRAATGTVLATLTGNGLNRPFAAAFDGERILITNYLGSSVSLWKASDLTPIGSVSTEVGARPLGACSDGINFWITLQNSGKLARF